MLEENADAGDTREERGKSRYFDKEIM